jgi:hypothetical protein
MAGRGELAGEQSLVRARCCNECLPERLGDQLRQIVLQGAESRGVTARALPLFTPFANFLSAVQIGGAPPAAAGNWRAPVLAPVAQGRRRDPELECGLLEREGGH